MQKFVIVDAEVPAVNTVFIVIVAVEEMSDKPLLLHVTIHLKSVFAETVPVV